MKKTKKLPEDQIIYPHGPPLTRRDMLRAGLIQFSAAMTLPSVYQWLARAGVAEAAEGCAAASAGAEMPVFIHLALAGGAAMSANVVFLDAGGSMLPSYSILGLGNPANLTITREFANRVAFPGNNVGGMITGLRTGATPLTLLNAAFVGIPVRSQDDSSNNMLDVTGAITRAGVKGVSLPNLGTQQSPTGGRHQAAYVPPPAPLVVSSYNDLASAINVVGALGTLSSNQKSGLFRLVNRLTTTQARNLASMSGGEQLAALTKCATGTNLELVSSGSTGTDPVENAAFAQVWNINAQTSRSSQNYVFAAMVYNAMKGNSGTVNLTMGGYDYHGNARTATNAQDTNAGLAMGRIIQSAAVMGKKTFLMVSSDGAVGAQMSDSATVNFSSDRGSGGAIYMMVYDPLKPPSASGQQVGQLTTGQAADDKFVTGDAPNLAAAAVVANYLSFAGRLGNFDAVMPRVFSIDQLSQVVKIAG